MDSTAASTQKRPLKQACDNCRRRKIKCNRANPCEKCQRLLLSCSYSDVLQRKGPKFRTLYPLAPLHPFSRQQQSPAHYVQGYEDSNAYSVESPASSTFSVHLGGRGQFPTDACHDRCCKNSSHKSASSPDSTNRQFDFSGGQLRPCSKRLSSLVLLAHVNVFLKYLFPIMPVVQKEQLLSDSGEPEKLSSQRYAFMASLCAATHIQLKLDGADSMVNAPAGDPGADGRSLMCGEALLTEAVRGRNEFDIIENVNVESLLTSFFLFAAYGNLDKQDHAWFYLSQSISMAHTLGLHRESTYSNMDVVEAEEKRRVFWLLFITERAYALQQAKPVMLRNSIEKPKVLYADDPILAYGFLNLINIFENLTVSLYDWVYTGCDSRFSELPPTSTIQSNLSNPISLEGVLEIQQVDILITQQWLQAMMWKLSLGHSSQSTPSGGPILPFHLPVLAGKTVMNVIGSVSQGAVDAHGIGMEQKLFDMGSSVADVARSLRSAATQRLTTAVVDPRELLWGILNTLSKIRGSQSYLFPTLLERSSTVLGLNTPAALTDLLPGSVDLSLWGNKEQAFGSVSHIEEIEDRTDEEHTSGTTLPEIIASIPDVPFLR